jgi:hypothetical protein
MGQAVLMPAPAPADCASRRVILLVLNFVDRRRDGLITLIHVPLSAPFGVYLLFWGPRGSSALRYCHVHGELRSCTQQG